MSETDSHPSSEEENEDRTDWHRILGLLLHPLFYRLGGRSLILTNGLRLRGNTALCGHTGLLQKQGWGVLMMMIYFGLICTNSLRTEMIKKGPQVTDLKALLIAFV